MQANPGWRRSGVRAAGRVAAAARAGSAPPSGSCSRSSWCSLSAGQTQLPLCPARSHSPSKVPHQHPHSSWPHATHTPSHPHQPSQKVADRFETYRVDLPPPGFAVNRRTRGAPIHLPALQEGHSNGVSRVRGIVRWYLLGKRLGPGRVEAPSRGRSEMGSCACVAGHTIM